jgi:hypothetical protein
VNSTVFHSQAGKRLVKTNSPRRFACVSALLSRVGRSTHCQSEQDLISLADMPTVYSLQFTPALTVTIDSYDAPMSWRFVMHYLRQWWSPDRRMVART